MSFEIFLMCIQLAGFQICDSQICLEEFIDCVLDGEQIEFCARENNKPVPKIKCYYDRETEI